jgi:hypothetical protein
MYSESETPDTPKPDDIVSYAFAPVCERDHVNGFGKDEITIKELTELLVCCRECGRPARYATIKRWAEAIWESRSIPVATVADGSIGKSKLILRYSWNQFHISNISAETAGPRWTRAERVRNITLEG